MELLQERHLIENGKIPADYTAIAHCIWCGNIFAPPEIAAYGKLQGCMWYLNRTKKMPIPKPDLLIRSNK